MIRWVITSTIAHFRDKLAVETDPLRRSVLEELLSQEEKRLVELEEDENQD